MWNSSDLSRLPVTFWIPWPLLALAILGLVAILGALGFGAWWVISHLQWVP